MLDDNAFFDLDALNNLGSRLSSIDNYLLPKVINQILVYDNVGSIIDQIGRANAQPGPYPSTLISRIEDLKSVRGTLARDNPGLVPLFDQWYRERVAPLINEAKMVEPPPQPKGFWASLFG